MVASSLYLLSEEVQEQMLDLTPFAPSSALLLSCSLLLLPSSALLLSCSLLLLPSSLLQLSSCLPRPSFSSLLPSSFRRRI